MKVQENTNMVSIIGTILYEPIFDYEAYGEKFFLIQLGIERPSGYVDTIPVIISECYLQSGIEYAGHIAIIKGQYRSMNSCGRLLLYVFAKEFESFNQYLPNVNEIELTGYICKQPKYRKTPLKREICDLTIAVNRRNGHADYIPIIAWGRNALASSNYEAGRKVHIVGRIQSRTYEKKISETEKVERIAYEVSASKISLKRDEEDA